MRRRTDADLRAILAIGVVLGALAGAWFGPRFTTPTALDTSVWNILVPGLDEDVVAPNLGRGTRILDGELLIAPHAFKRSDRLAPRDPRAIGRAEVELAADSGELTIVLHAGASGSFFALALGPDAWETSLRPGGRNPHVRGQPYVILQENSGISVDGVALTGQGATPGAIELTAEGEEVHLRAIRLYDPAGAVVIDERWPPGPVRPFHLLVGAAIGALAGFLAGRRALLALVLAAGILLVPLVPHQTWLATVERLFLVRTPTWELARACLALATAPLALAALLHSGLLVPADRRTGDLPSPVWAAIVVLASLAASRDGWVAALPGAAFLALPMWVAARAGLARGAVLSRDLPALVACAALGWGSGLLLAVLWRAVLVAAAARTLLVRAPTIGANSLFFLALLLPVATEIAVRDSYLAVAWDAARLAGEDLGMSESGDGDLAFWEGSCGQQPTANVYFLGGSSVGGAYQMGTEPEAFFPARVHALLCAEGTALRTWNYGDGGHDSFTIARGLARTMAAGAPDVAVLYLGVNDLLTQNSGLTRKQREVEQAKRGEALRGLSGIAARSRLISGLSLFWRPVGVEDEALVADVPIADAEENLRWIAAEVIAAGGRVLLAPELADAETARRLAPYRALQARLAAEIEGVEYLDLAALDPSADPALLVDRNHLSHAGHTRVAEQMAPLLRELLR